MILTTLVTIMCWRKVLNVSIGQKVHQFSELPSDHRHPSQVPQPTCFWKSYGEPVYATPTTTQCLLEAFPSRWNDEKASHSFWRWVSSWSCWDAAASSPPEKKNKKSFHFLWWNKTQSQLVWSFESQSWVKVKVVKWCRKKWSFHYAKLHENSNFIATGFSKPRINTFIFNKFIYPHNLLSQT